MTDGRRQMTEVRSQRSDERGQRMEGRNRQDRVICKNKATYLLKIMSIVIWDFSNVFRKSNRFYLNQVELALTFR